MSNFRNLTIITCLCVPFALAAQTRKSYPSPAKTPEVVRLLNERVRWSKPASRAKVALPQSVDNSTSRFFPPLIDQQGGSCAQASGIGYMFTYEMNRLLGRTAAESKSYTFNYMFTWNFLNGGKDEGGFVEQGLNIAQRYGCMTNADFGTAGLYEFRWATGFDKYLNALKYRVRKIYQFDSTTPEGIEDIKSYLYNKGGNDARTAGGVVTFSTLSRDWKINDHYQGASQTGYHSIMQKLATQGAHALTIVGYDDTVESVDADGKKQTGAFIVVNSWGSYSHDNGRFYLPYHFFLNRKGITELQLSSDMTGIEVTTHEPLIVFKVRVNYSSRDDLSFVCGADDNAASNYPQNRYSNPVFSNQGGDYPPAGAYAKDNVLEMALDYTDHLPSADYQYKKYFLNVIRSQRGDKQGEGTIDYLSVIDYREKGNPKEYVCRKVDKTPLEWGNNWFSMSLVPQFVSTSPFKWMNADKGVSGKTFLIRTVSGKYAKVRFTDYTSGSGKATIRYTIQRDGSTNLNKAQQ